MKFSVRDSRGVFRKRYFKSNDAALRWAHSHKALALMGRRRQAALIAKVELIGVLLSTPEYWMAA